MYSKKAQEIAQEIQKIMNDTVALMVIRNRDIEDVIEALDDEIDPKTGKMIGLNSQSETNRRLAALYQALYEELIDLDENIEEYINSFEGSDRQQGIEKEWGKTSYDMLSVDEMKIMVSSLRESAYSKFRRNYNIAMKKNISNWIMPCRESMQLIDVAEIEAWNVIHSARITEDPLTQRWMLS